MNRSFRILVVEDSLPHLHHMVALIREHGHEAVSAMTATTFVLENINGVLTDLFLPLSNETFYEADEPRGFDVAARARQAGIPVVMCTSLDRDDIAERYSSQFAEQVPNEFQIVGKKDQTLALALLVDMIDQSQ